MKDLFKNLVNWTKKEGYPIILFLMGFVAFVVLVKALVNIFFK